MAIHTISAQPLNSNALSFKGTPKGLLAHLTEQSVSQIVTELERKRGLLDQTIQEALTKKTQLENSFQKAKESLQGILKRIRKATGLFEKFKLGIEKRAAEKQVSKIKTDIQEIQKSVTQAETTRAKIDVTLGELRAKLQ